ncbi:MAG TPA: J domain-containing protein [Sphingomicrobium sp.]|nr:J domain-containing protein [Sphingomicrobium sp.]
MGAPASAYAALGLEPGADRTAIEQAYRRLIKLHHPDRSGGDASRAAEINRAYFELRRQPEPDPPPAAGRGPVRPRNSVRKRRRRSRRSWLALIAAAGVLLVFERERLAEPTARWIASLFAVPETGRGSLAKIGDPELDGPLADTAIESSIGQARRFVRSGDEEAMAQHSRDCHRRMRSSPELVQLDRCAAFDDAIAALGDSAATGDRGRFGAAALTARQMTAASLLSSDYLAIERRLDRVRTAVQMALITRLPPLPPSTLVDENPADAALPDDDPDAGSN